MKLALLFAFAVLSEAVRLNTPTRSQRGTPSRVALGKSLFDSSGENTTDAASSADNEREGNNDGVDRECAICLDENVTDKELNNKLPCGHGQFHRACVVKALRSNGQCPMCRHSVPLDVEDWKLYPPVNMVEYN